MGIGRMVEWRAPPPRQGRSRVMSASGVITAARRAPAPARCLGDQAHRRLAPVVIGPEDRARCGDRRPRRRRWHAGPCSGRPPAESAASTHHPIPSSQRLSEAASSCASTVAPDGVTPPGLARQVHVSGNRAFVADHASGFSIIDVSDPTRPALLGTAVTADFAEAVVMSSNHVFVAAASSGLQVFNAANPLAQLARGTGYPGSC